MKKIVLLVAVAFLYTGVASAKPDFAKATGYKCAECHTKGMKKENTEANKENPLFLVSFNMNADMAKQGTGEYGEKKTVVDFKGKKACADCHDGKGKFKK
ncbi:MAG: hypothetical protein A2X86_22010 [Bdellovibrionales bacterium GWA2_49_15]|nr:MAG: hypothetical protein A2X86_22010 [Bdellovibrionales bacterium GWA2_49_15]HAZ15010.1 hypothetical protein [Bdellovibrionales bacterium]